MPYCTFGCAHAGHLDHLHLAAGGLRVGRVDEAGVGLAQRDLREHLADVRLLADDVFSTALDRFMFFRICSV